MQSLTLPKKLDKKFHKGDLKAAMVPAHLEPYPGLVTLHTKDGEHNVFVKSIETIKPSNMCEEKLKHFGFKSQKSLLKSVNKTYDSNLSTTDTFLALHWI